MSFDIKLGNDFLHIPKLPADGKGFVVWKDRLKLSIRARGLYGHLDGTVTRPSDPPTRPEGSTLTEEEVSSNMQYERDLNKYLQEQAVVFQQIASTIPDSLYLKIKGKTSVKEAWETLKADFKKRSRMVTVDLRKCLYDIRCTENGNIRTHLDNVRTMREELASLGTILSESDLSAIVLGSLPKSYDQFLSAVTATASVLKQELNPEDLMQTVIDEFDRRSTRPGAHKEKGTDIAFFAGGAGNNRGGRNLKSNRDIECFNCHKKGHKKPDCWAKGGGKEGQGPKWKDRKPKGGESKEGARDGNKELANVAGDEEGVWMATVSDSGDEDMAKDEFGDFEVSENDQFFFDNDEEVTDLATHLKKLLSISKPPYDNPHDIFNIEDSDDSSDDDKGAAAMQVVSDSDSDIEISPYWSKIKVDELQGLGNAIENPETDMDSMPDLQNVSESDDLSIIFILTPPNSPCSENSDKDSLEEDFVGSFSDEEMTELVMDEGEEGHTGFTAAMLVNVEGSVEGVQTELYDSGASRHMSPYRDHFENYIPIIPKSITAADKRYFQAIGKGDLRIKLPNGSATTTILLKDVLHCPDMGLTLVSISKITAAGYKVIFRGPTCKVFDSKDKVIGLINVRNGLYRVDHDRVVNVGMAEKPKKS